MSIDENLAAPFTICLEGYIPKSLNVILRQHWSKRGNAKSSFKKEVERHFNSWWYTLDASTRSHLNKQFPIKKCEFILLHYYFKDKRKRDFDNYSGKIIFDVLKQMIIIDDSSEVVGELRIKFTYSCDSNYTVIVIQPKEGA